MYNNNPKKKKKLRKGFVRDLVILLGLVAAPVWAAALICVNPIQSAVLHCLANFPLYIAAGVGTVIDSLLLSCCVMGGEWW